jgi:hypothetical protein
VCSATQSGQTSPNMSNIAHFARVLFSISLTNRCQFDLHQRRRELIIGSYFVVGFHSRLQAGHLQMTTFGSGNIDGSQQQFFADELKAGRLRQGSGYDDRLDLGLISKNSERKQALDEEESAAWTRLNVMIADWGINWGQASQGNSKAQHQCCWRSKGFSRQSKMAHQIRGQASQRDIEPVEMLRSGTVTTGRMDGKSSVPISSRHRPYQEADRP